VCTPGVDGPNMIAARRGTCQPADLADALGLLAWPADGGGDRPLAYYWISQATYTQLDCPSFSIEIRDGDGYRAGPDEDGCSGVVFPQSSTLIIRPGPVIEDRPATVRARGRYLTECFSSEPSGCGGSVELVSDDVDLSAP
jgi:hypothetical protein